jgi:hypothetical protein
MDKMTREGSHDVRAHRRGKRAPVFDHISARASPHVQRMLWNIAERTADQSRVLTKLTAAAVLPSVKLGDGRTRKTATRNAYGCKEMMRIITPIAIAVTARTEAQLLLRPVGPRLRRLRLARLNEMMATTAQAATMKNVIYFRFRFPPGPIVK